MMVKGLNNVAYVSLQFGDIASFLFLELWYSNRAIYISGSVRQNWLTKKKQCWQIAATTNKNPDLGEFYPCPVVCFLQCLWHSVPLKRSGITFRVCNPKTFAAFLLLRYHFGLTPWYSGQCYLIFEDFCFVCFDFFYVRPSDFFQSIKGQTAFHWGYQSWTSS